MVQPIEIKVKDSAYLMALPDSETDYIQRKIANEKQPYEAAMLADMFARLPQDSCYIDIGSNVGNHALYMACVANCKVYAFEPNSHLVKAIKSSIKLNNKQRQVKVFNIGLGENPTTAEFVELRPDNLGAQSLSTGQGSIKVERLDDQAIKSAVGIIKIDVEGMELSVLKGARQTIAQHRPLLYVECQTEDDFNIISAYLAEQNYSYWDTFNATPTHLFIPSEKLTLDDRLSRLQFTQVRELYAFQQKLNEANRKLNETNVKYRHANTDITELKSKLDAANEKYRAASDLVSKLKRQLEDAQGQYKHTVEELNEARAKYRVVSEQQGVLKQSVAELNAKLAENAKDISALQQEQKTHLAVQQSLQEKLALALAEKQRIDEQLTVSVAENKRINDNFDEQQEVVKALKFELEQANAKYKNSCNNVDVLKDKNEKLQTNLANVKLQQLEWVEQTEQLTRQIGQLQHEASAFAAKETELLQQLQGKEMQFLASQQQYAQLSAEITQLREALQQKEAEQQRLSCDYQQALHNAEQQILLLKDTQNVKERSVTLSPVYIELESAFLTLQQEHQHTLLQQQTLQQQNSDLYAVKTKLTDDIASHLQNRQQAEQSLLAVQQQANALNDKLHGLEQQHQTMLQQAITDNSELDVFRALARPQAELFIISPKLAGVLQPTAQLQHRYQQHAAQLTNIRIACIMDEFTFGSYAPEANLVQLTPQYWLRELNGFKPQLLFIESAWRGKHEIWGNKVGHKCQELVDIVHWCKSRNIPTIFWNKEDPVHFETFISTAKLFDHVFTTDIDCIHRYKAALEHNNVYLLPFAAQPSVNNPIEKYARKKAFCFAGAYYVRYPDRTRDLESFVSAFPAYRPLEIYDRNFGKNDENYQFPEEYQPFIVGNLPYEQIDKAYKGYQYAINLNSIKHSQTMFARRVYELLASNTLTVSNYSRGVKQMFGELVACSDDGENIVNWLQRIEADSQTAAAVRLYALRNVMMYHTYQDRLAYIAKKAGLTTDSALTPAVTVLAYAKNQQRYEHLLQQFNRQRYSAKHLVLAYGNEVTQFSKQADITNVAVAELKNVDMAQLIGNKGWAAFMVAEDLYAEHYLTDMVLATRYAPGAVVGKSSYWRAQPDNSAELNYAGSQYQQGVRVEARAAIVQASALPAADLYQILTSLQKLTFEQTDTLGIDAFNYCKAGGLYGNTALLSKIQEQYSGQGACDFSKLERFAEQIAPAVINSLIADAHSLSPSQLNQLFVEGNKQGKVALSLANQVLDIVSPLDDGKHEYLYGNTLLPISTLPVNESGELELHLEATPGLNLQLLVGFFDSNQKKLSHAIKYANKNHSIAVPENTQYVQLALRFYARGSCAIKRLLWKHLVIQPQAILPQSDVLLLTNHYPSYDALYRNGFVHSRVKAYRERGVNVDVFRLRTDEPVSWHEFQGVEVLTASQHALKQILATGHYRHVLVHFLDASMWEVLKEFIDTIKVTVWVHGAEIQPWWRREYNYSDEASLERAKVESGIRQAFWRSVLVPFPENLHLVFVSQYFADEVLQDLELELPAKYISVVHNPIDTDLFSYEEKNVEQRFNWLSIRPFASAKYANDLTVSAILEISKEPWFDKLKITIIGDGVLFDEITEPLKKFENVVLDRGFKTQVEIAKLHKQYGVFFSPSRMDAQGVSRDEAMASGLVPVTNGVTAIPEFTDPSCAILAPANDYSEMVSGLIKLVTEPTLFESMSRKAAERVKKQSEINLIINKEISLIYKDKPEIVK